MGMATNLTTNGMLLDERRVAYLQGAVDFMAISIDGAPASHNRIRGSENAFAGMAARLPIVREAGIHFGFIFTLTGTNVDELEWVARFAFEQGASLLQIHPLEEVGRAQEELHGSEPNDLDRELAWLSVANLRAKYMGTRFVCTSM
jgi:MoaA/NifB/PqqE/SkfB family radical SAM enzyme